MALRAFKLWILENQPLRLLTSPAPPSWEPYFIHFLDIRVQMQRAGTKVLAPTIIGLR